MSERDVFVIIREVCSMIKYLINKKKKFTHLMLLLFSLPSQTDLPQVSLKKMKKKRMKESKNRVVGDHKSEDSCSSHCAINTRTASVLLSAINFTKQDAYDIIPIYAIRSI